MYSSTALEQYGPTLFKIVLVPDFLVEIFDVISSHSRCTLGTRFDGGSSFAFEAASVPYKSHDTSRTRYNILVPDDLPIQRMIFHLYRRTFHILIRNYLQADEERPIGPDT